MELACGIIRAGCSVVVLLRIQNELALRVEDVIEYDRIFLFECRTTTLLLLLILLILGRFDRRSVDRPGDRLERVFAFFDPSWS